MLVVYALGQGRYKHCELSQNLYRIAIILDGSVQSGN